jgi:pimeloyl-ACP methyl ester carboxylesterase
MIFDEKAYRKVPNEQTSLYKQFIKNHPYEKKEYKGTEFEFLKAGEGKQTIILLPGAFMKPYMWFYVMSKLSEKYQVISPNIPKTCVGGKEKIDHIKELIDSLSLKKVIMLGYSYGGGLAQYFVEKYPEYVEILVLSHTGVFRREDPVEQTESLLRKIRYSLSLCSEST